MKILIAKAYTEITFDGLLAQELQRRGHEVHLLLPATGPDAESRRRQGMTIHVNPVIAMRAQRKIRPDRDVAGFFRLVSLLRRERYDIINLHLPAARLFGRLASRFLKKKKVVSVMHGLEAHHERWTHRFDDAAVCVSRAVKNFLASRGIPVGKMHVIHNGIDFETFDRIPRDPFRLHRELGLEKNIRLIGMAAYFYRPRDTVDKGHGIFIDAARILSRRYPDVRFVIIGSDRLTSGQEQSFREYARRTGVDGCLYFLGERKDVPAAMDSLSVHVLPSRKEGFGLVVVEAMARGIPNAASNLETIREIVTDGRDGVLFSPGEAGDLARAVSGLLDDPGRAARIGRAGRQRAESHFTVQRMGGEYEDLFRELLKPGR